MRKAIGVVGGVGGIGASTFAAVVASLCGGVLVDVDAVGGGIDVLLGIEHLPGARWSSVRVAGGRVESSQLRDGLARWGAVPVLAADVAPAADAVGAVLAAAGELGDVVVDLGRAPSAARSVAMQSCAVVVVLVAADVAGVSAARATARELADIRTALVVRRGHLASAEVAELVGAEVLGELPPPGVRSQRRLSPSRLPRPIVRVASGIVDGLGG